MATETNELLVRVATNQDATEVDNPQGDPILGMGETIVSHHFNSAGRGKKAAVNQSMVRLGNLSGMLQPPGPVESARTHVTSNGHATMLANYSY